MMLSEQDLDFLKQLRAAGERGRTIQASNIRVALDRLAKKAASWSRALQVSSWSTTGSRSETEMP